MRKQLNALEKEFLIKRFRDNPSISIGDFCEANGVTVQSLRKWMRLYDEKGIEGLYRMSDKSPAIPLLPEGMDESAENYKRQPIRLTIENERLKKSYSVRMGPDGKPEYVPLRAKNMK